MSIQVGRFYLTDSGIKLQSEAQTGYPLTFTRCGISEQVINSLDELQRLEKLTDEKGSFGIYSKKINDDGTASIVVDINNNKVETGYLVRTIGLYAKDLTGEEKLYCVAHNATGATFLPPSTISQEQWYIEIKTVVGNASNLTITVDENPSYVNKIEFDDLAGKGRTTENVKENADNISEFQLRLSLVEASLGLAESDGQIAITFDDIEPEHVLDGVWDKAGKRLMI